MNTVPKLLITFGILIVIVGLLWQLGGKYLPLGKLPGDVVVENGNFRFYFPLTTSIILSIVLTFLFWVFYLMRK